MNEMVHLMIPAELVRRSGIDLCYRFRVYADDHRLIIEQPYRDCGCDPDEFDETADKPYT